ncbi:trehalose synthase [Punctularia strigosozonata HHB-11173 SS5]|uniref:trehalose synthase n=1 Tax=Punctularia strigosozonata (strain HHB-11173) TaxID=741275 RepID=UPI0004418242|nr:trehalose synthase [Punctularia strigosozonata HHB-11173 SS5]EIN08084.1 trehalose synthase [Punctularia strigosozonata HHB-11173 SS5]
MAPPSPTVERHETFTSRSAEESRRRRASDATSKSSPSFSNLTPMWAGIAGMLTDGSTGIELALSIHDGIYTTDFQTALLPYDKKNPDAQSEAIEELIIDTLRRFSKDHMCKFIGAGITMALLKEAPNLCTRLWLELDIVPIVFNIKPYHTESKTRPNIKHRVSYGPSAVASGAASGSQTPAVLVDAAQAQGLLKHLGVQSATGKLPIPRNVDEQSDSAARKCLMYFGPGNNPRLEIGPRNQVLVDAAGKIHLIDDLDEYRKGVHGGTWEAVIAMAEELREKNVKIGFFSSTPQGGGVALMRHALIRFLTLLDVDARWYVPNPSPQVFRTTKNNHNILQGVAAPDVRLTDEQKEAFDAWILKNGLRWTAEGGPLAPGGVDIAFIDDPQMPGLIPLIKKVRPDLPIIYRSHIEIRSDLVHKKGSPQEEVWQYLWKNIQLADMFISHPVNKFVPSDVPVEKLSLLGAATDWLDGLNKHLDSWDSQFYMGEFRGLCIREKMNTLAWPQRDYVVQVARFDPSKGIPHVIDSYSRLRQLLAKHGMPEADHPQLLVCGHGAVDDPDASIIYDETLRLINDTYSEYAQDIVVMRIPPSDQLLNALMANGKIALQLSTREGFEVKVSEALHAGIPVVASRTGGIPLQIQHGKSGYLVDAGDNASVAQHLFELYTDKALYKRVSEFAANNVSDEVGTVGNASAWMYLAMMYVCRGAKLKPNGRWLNDMMREEMGKPLAPGEPQLPRTGLNIQG